MLSNWFATPEFLYTLLAVPLCIAFMLFAFWRRRQALRAFGNVLLVRRSLLVRPRVRFGKALGILLTLGLVAVAAAGPQWGIDKAAQRRKGRDVIVVFDLSRSMLAGQPSRRTLAVRSLRHLADALQEQGGQRVALIGFAAKPRLFFPLTQDYDHLRHVLAQIEVGDYPPLSTEEPISGTRIGAALSLAVALADPHRANRPVIVLLSDGDDPANDDEWRGGALDAKEKQIRVHTVGFGDPKSAETIPLGRGVYSFDGKPIKTTLNEARLQEIVGQTQGRYFGAHTSAIDLGIYLQHLLAAEELREEAPGEHGVSVRQLRYAWPLLPALCLFLATLYFSEGPRPQTDAPRHSPRVPTRSRLIAPMVVLLALCSISAADAPKVDVLLRRGDEAFAAREYGEALKCYEEAEGWTDDPGLVSFNQAATLFRLERHKEAIDCYRRALADDRAPPERKARMYFDLGNALAHNAGERSAPLAEAVVNYRKCLHQSNLPAKLRDDARHNLELAQLRWLKAKQQEPAETKPPDAPPKKDPLDAQNAKQADDGYKKVEIEPKKNADGQEDSKGTKSKNVHLNQHVTVLDDANVQSIAREDTLSTLAAHIQRITQDRLKLRHPPGPAALSTKDW